MLPSIIDFLLRSFVCLTFCMMHMRRMPDNRIKTVIFMSLSSLIAGSAGVVSNVWGWPSMEGCTTTSCSQLIAWHTIADNSLRDTPLLTTCCASCHCQQLIARQNPTSCRCNKSTSNMLSHNGLACPLEGLQTIPSANFTAKCELYTCTCTKLHSRAKLLKASKFS